MARGNQDESPEEKLSELSNIREQYESLFKEVSTLNKEISRREKMARLAAAKAEAEARKAAEEKAEEEEEKDNTMLYIIIAAFILFLIAMVFLFFK